MPSTAVRDPAVHLGVMKLGCGTGLTRGEVKSVNVKVKIAFPSGVALFVGQFLTKPDFGGFGDSGALVVTNDAAVNPLGMVIGGGNNGSAIVTPIRPILQRFNATVYGRQLRTGTSGSPHAPGRSAHVRGSTAFGGRETGGVTPAG